MPDLPDSTPSTLFSWEDHPAFRFTFLMHLSSIYLRTRRGV